MSSPREASTGTPRSTSAAATSSCVVSGLAEHSAASAPPAISACIRFAVSAVTCRHAAIFTPSSGCSSLKRSRMERRTGMWPCAHSIRASPAWARAGSAMSCLGRPGIAAGPGGREPPGLIPIVLGLVRPLDRHADVGRLLRGQLGELRAEGVEVQPGDLLVEVLRQDVHPLLVLVVLREQL